MFFFDAVLINRYKGDLKVHYKTKHGGNGEISVPKVAPRASSNSKEAKAFPCILKTCNSGYSYKRDLIRHFRQKHPDAPIELQMEIEIMESQHSANGSPDRDEPEDLSEDGLLSESSIDSASSPLSGAYFDFDIINDVL